MKSNDKLGCLPEIKTGLYPLPEEGDLELLAEQFGGRLALRYGLVVLNNIDANNEALRETIYDSVYDHIDMDEFFKEYIEACGNLGFNQHNCHYAGVFKMLKDDGYVTWGDNYEIGSL